MLIGRERKGFEGHRLDHVMYLVHGMTPRKTKQKDTKRIDHYVSPLDIEKEKEKEERTRARETGCPVLVVCSRSAGENKSD